MKGSSRMLKDGFVDQLLAIGYLCILSAYVSLAVVNAFVSPVRQLAGKC